MIADDGDDGGFGDSAGWGNTDNANEKSLDTGDLLQAPRNVKKVSVLQGFQTGALFLKLSSTAMIGEQPKKTCTDIMLCLQFTEMTMSLHRLFCVFVLLAVLFWTGIHSIFS